MGDFMQGVVAFLLYLVPFLICVWIVRYLVQMSQERRRLRLKVAKLAHEMESLRADLGRSADKAENPLV